MTGVIKDPLGQTHGPTSSDYYPHLKVLICAFLKSEEGRTDKRHV